MDLIFNLFKIFENFRNFAPDVNELFSKILTVAQMIQPTLKQTITTHFLSLSPFRNSTSLPCSEIFQLIQKWHKVTHFDTIIYPYHGFITRNYTKYSNTGVIAGSKRPFPKRTKFNLAKPKKGDVEWPSTLINFAPTLKNCQLFSMSLVWLLNYDRAKVESISDQNSTKNGRSKIFHVLSYDLKRLFFFSREYKSFVMMIYSRDLHVTGSE